MQMAHVFLLYLLPLPKNNFPISTGSFLHVKAKNWLYGIKIIYHSNRSRRFLYISRFKYCLFLCSIKGSFTRSYSTSVCNLFARWSVLIFRPSPKDFLSRVLKEGRRRFSLFTVDWGIRRVFNPFLEIKLILPSNLWRKEDFKLDSVLDLFYLMRENL